jgi:hypothetical protein
MQIRTGVEAEAEAEGRKTPRVTLFLQPRARASNEWIFRVTSEDEQAIGTK